MCVCVQQKVKVLVHYGEKCLDNPEEAIILGVYNGHVVRNGREQIQARIPERPAQCRQPCILRACVCMYACLGVCVVWFSGTEFELPVEATALIALLPLRGYVHLHMHASRAYDV